MGEYLIAQGYRVLGFVGGPGPRSETRLQGFEQAARRGHRIVVRPLMLTESTSYAAGRQALDRLLQSRPTPDAIFFSNDPLAVGALMECQRRGIQVPEELAIAGFADLDIAAETVPSLTTMQVHAKAIGTHAAELVLQRLAGQMATTTQLDLGFSLVIRESA